MRYGIAVGAGLVETKGVFHVLLDSVVITIAILACEFNF